MLLGDGKEAVNKTWIVTYVAYTIMKAMEAQPFADEASQIANEKLIESTIKHLSKSLLKLNNGIWD